MPGFVQADTTYLLNANCVPGLGILGASLRAAPDFSSPLFHSSPVMPQNSRPFLTRPFPSLVELHILSATDSPSSPCTFYSARNSNLVWTDKLLLVHQSPSSNGPLL